MSKDNRFAVWLNNIGIVIRDRLKSVISSMRVRIILLILLLSWIPLILLGESLLYNMQESRINQRVEQLQYEVQTVAREMSRNTYMSDSDAEVNAQLDGQIELIADEYDGRIMIVDDNYLVIKDTFGTAVGRYDATSQVMSAFLQIEGWDEARIYSGGRNYAEFVQVIYNQSLEKIRGVIVVSISTEDIVKDMAEERDKYQTLTLALSILIAAIAFFFTLLLMRPVKRLKKEMERANSGDMELIQVKGFKETAEIAEVYNASLTRLKHLDESRQEFVSNVSHELKTPITSIRILADSLNTMQGAPVELYQEFMQDISNEVDRESRIIDDLLEIVRLDRKAQTLHITKVNLNDMLAAVMKRLKPNADMNHITLNLECMRQVVADADEIKLTRVITNLVENGIKYNKDTGSVSVTLNADQTYFYIKTVDTGVGIPEDEVDKIFERFYRVDKARSRETGGTGLGLTICQSIVQMHHGVIRVSSDYGEGTTFVIRIPLIYIP